MILVKFDNQEITQQSLNLSLLTSKSDELLENPIMPFVVNEPSDNVINLSLFDEFDNFSNQTKNILLTADNTANDIDELIKKPIDKVIFFVKDFKDGRTFSLIRYLKNKDFTGEIYVLGYYGLDQANYYIKSGATGFFVKDEQLETILKTLEDLKSGHFGQSVSGLPMFR